MLGETGLAQVRADRDGSLRHGALLREARADRPSVAASRRRLHGIMLFSVVEGPGISETSLTAERADPSSAAMEGAHEVIELSETQSAVGSRRGVRLRPGDLSAARALGEACRVSTTAAQVMLHRGVVTPEEGRRYLDPRLSGLTPPEQMAALLAALDTLQ